MQPVLDSLTDLQPGPKIRAITFDVGGTLIEPYPSVGHVYAEVGARYGLRDRTPDQLLEGFIGAWKVKREFDYSRAAWLGLVAAAFGRGTSELPEGFFEAVYGRFEEVDVWRVYPDVQACLERMRDRGLKVGIISNWDERLRPLLAKLGLAGFFDDITISCEVGVVKPGGEIFERALGGLGVTAESCLHVGDSHREEVEGAHEAGMTGLLVRR